MCLILGKEEDGTPTKRKFGRTGAHLVRPGFENYALDT